MKVTIKGLGSFDIDSSPEVFVSEWNRNREDEVLEQEWFIQQDESLAEADKKKSITKLRKDFDKKRPVLAIEDVKVHDNSPPTDIIGGENANI